MGKLTKRCVAVKSQCEAAESRNGALVSLSRLARHTAGQLGTTADALEQWNQEHSSSATALLHQAEINSANESKASALLTEAKTKLRATERAITETHNRLKQASEDLKTVTRNSEELRLQTHITVETRTKLQHEATEHKQRLVAEACALHARVANLVRSLVVVLTDISSPPCHWSSTRSGNKLPRVSKPLTKT